ncbi:MAG: DUF1365 domain-containing protein [Coraliomargaritaceae bacterium]
MDGSLQSFICRGEVVHQRLHPTQHTFTYPMTFFVFKAEEIPELHQTVRLFAHNAPALLSIRDSDYLEGGNRSIPSGVDRFLPGRSSDEEIWTVTSPRYFGYAFNPVNFHLRMKDQSLTGVIAEVNNTFGDRHVYPLDQLKKTAAHRWEASCSKDFHVSPFNNVEGTYHFTFIIKKTELHMGVDLFREGKCVMKTWLCGTKRPLTNANIWKYALFHPFDTALNSMPRILWQAGQLYFRKYLSAYQRPKPRSKYTLVDRDKAGGENNLV